MYVLQNALKNLARNKGRNIMIGAIIFVIILTTVVALVINNTAAVVIEDYRERFGSEVYITPDMQKVQEEMFQKSESNGIVSGRVSIKIPQLSSELYLRFTESEYLKESYATADIDANCGDIRAIAQSDDTDGGNNNAGPSMGGAGMSFVGGGGGNFRLAGDTWQDFKDGLRTIESGDFPQNDNECIISADLRDENGINMGDILTFTANVSIDEPEGFNPDVYNDGDTVTIDDVDYTLSKMGMEGEIVMLNREVAYELKVVGVYNDYNEEYENEYLPQVAALNRRNEVLTTLNTLLAGRYANEDGVRVNVTYYLKDPAMLAAFDAQVREMGLPDTFKVDTDAASYERIVKPVLGLKGISITFMIVVLILGAIILLLLCSISIRERKYEIGVLRAMGMKKSAVSMGLMAEIFMITCVCLVLGLGVGTAISQPVSDMLLENQAAAAEEAMPQGPMGAPMGGMVGYSSSGGGKGPMFINSAPMSGAKPLSEMKITLDFITVLEIVAVAIFLALLAGLVSISRITKYEPIKILMERN